MINKISNVRKIIADELKQAGIKSAEIDAGVLLEFVTKKSREFLLANPDYNLSGVDIKNLDDLIVRRKKHEPIAYIIGHKEFYGLDFAVTPDVLIPRLETEILVDETLKFIKSRNLSVLDVGTGSGNIIISIGKNSSGKFYASDISNSAIKIAKQNAKKHKVDIKFFQSDLFENVSGKFDLIVANLPYVPESDDKEIKYEPQSAIFADDNGTAIIKRFLTDAKNYINDNGMILFELDPRNAKELERFAKDYFSQVSLIKDYSNKLRILEILT